MPNLRTFHVGVTQLSKEPNRWRLDDITPAPIEATGAGPSAVSVLLAGAIAGGRRSQTNQKGTVRVQVDTDQCGDDPAANPVMREEIRRLTEEQLQVLSPGAAVAVRL
jgi:hypothetical protein